MDKSLIREVKCIISAAEEYDYISRLKYVIFLICRELYALKNECPVKEPAVFKEFSKFDLKDSKTELRIAEFMALNGANIEVSSFYPASLYEGLLTGKEKKSLGQVYTPFEIIDKMINEVFNIKNIDSTAKILDPSCGGGYFLIGLYKYISRAHPDFDKRSIVENMLFGIDIDDFSIFLSKMGLIFHTGLDNIKFNINKGDFLTDDINLCKYPPHIVTQRR